MHKLYQIYNNFKKFIKMKYLLKLILNLIFNNLLYFQVIYNLNQKNLLNYFHK